ncbi:hypothetical protein ACLOJK_015276 [Asimina triloba]
MIAVVSFIDGNNSIIVGIHSSAHIRLLPASGSVRPPRFVRSVLTQICINARLVVENPSAAISDLYQQQCPPQTQAGSLHHRRHHTWSVAPGPSAYRPPASGSVRLSSVSAWIHPPIIIFTEQQRWKHRRRRHATDQRRLRQ